MKTDYTNSNKHRVDCAWCQKVLVEGPEPISHGICDPCRDKVIEDLKTSQKQDKEGEY